ncbi:MAG TPA: protein kinase, partial [Ktedonobacteraceae bacterium]|nr:protein kinase [Ktedonobacteraceae bacterium]
MSTVRVDQLVGQRLGEYQIEQLLGRGEMSSVYRGQQTAQGRAVMITIFNLPDRLSAQEHEYVMQRFTRDNAALVRLTHPNILPTYAFGELAGHPYLVTAFARGASLSQLYKQMGRLTPQQTLHVLRQLTSALDYAHSLGVTHNSLSLAHVLTDQDLHVQIASFGLKTIFEARSGAVFAGTRSDIYALGMMLFELLSGLPFPTMEQDANSPWVEETPSSPSVHTACPAVPEAFDLVISKALEQNPTQWYQHAGDVTVAFESTLKMLEGSSPSPSSGPGNAKLDTQVTLPPTVNWFDEANLATGAPPQQIPAPLEYSPTIAFSPSRESSSAGNNPDSMAGIDPFNWWSATGSSLPATPGTMRQPTTLARPGSHRNGRRRPAQQERRKVVALIATGTVAAGVLALGGVSLARSLQQSQLAQTSNTPTNQPQTKHASGTPNAARPGHTPTRQATQPAPTATPSNQPTPTPTPAPQPTQPPPTP